MCHRTVFAVSHKFWHIVFPCSHLHIFMILFTFWVLSSPFSCSRVCFLITTYFWIFQFPLCYWFTTCLMMTSTSFYFFVFPNLSLMHISSLSFRSFIHLLVEKQNMLLAPQTYYDHKNIEFLLETSSSSTFPTLLNATSILPFSWVRNPVMNFDKLLCILPTDSQLYLLILLNIL